ncbi:MAG: hypothetical protein V9E89_15270 [Ilumatobacteraceae bacterium]
MKIEFEDMAARLKSLRDAFRAEFEAERNLENAQEALAIAQADAALEIERLLINFEK